MLQLETHKSFYKLHEYIQRTKPKILPFFSAFVGLVFDLHFRYNVLEQAFILAYFFKN